MNKTWYIDECNRQLNDTKFYQHLSEDITADMQKNVSLLTLTKYIVTSLSTTKPNNTRTFYILLKYIGPVIQDAPLSHHPTERMSQVVDYYLQPLSS